jgi:hypothetical protein
MYAVLLCTWILVHATIATSDFWAGVDTFTSISPPVNIINTDGLDSPTQVYPAIESHGSIYLPAGNIIMSNGDIYVAGTSVSAMSAYISAVATRLCSRTCGATTMLDVVSCTCVCNPGFVNPPLCLDMHCYNGGTWSSVDNACTCIPPYTSASFCRDIYCGQNAVIDAQTATCRCIIPYTGPNCSVVDPSMFVTYASDACFDRSSTACGSKNNYGVAMCNDAIGVCTCPPLYPSGVSAVYLRAMTCPAYDATCIASFAVLAPICCTVTTSVCEQPPDASWCFDELCCQSILSPAVCIVSNCQWSSSMCTSVGQTAAPVWSLRTMTCDATSSSHSLCSTDVAIQQQALFQQQPDPFQSIQTRAWRYISTFAIWDDGITHSVVISTPQQISRLAAIFNGPYWSSFVWSTSYAVNFKHTTQFAFEMVEDTAVVSAADIGSVYRIWISSFCLVDRPLQQDERAQLGIPPTVPSDAIIMWDTSTPYADISIADCGLFTVGDNIITPYNAMWAISDTAPVYVTQQPPSITSITTPSSIQDASDFPTPLVVPDMIACQRATCLLDYVVGQCTTVACARAMFTDPLQWDLCKPCVAAHVSFFFAAPSGAFQ